MIDPMRHMGNSGKFALIAAVAALGMLVLTAITLEEAVMVTFLGLVALAYVSAVAEVLARGRRLALIATGAGTSLTVAFSLAFLSTWELAFANQSSFLGTPLPTGDPDNYFYWAAASAVSTLFVLFLAAAWPAGRQLGVRGKPSPANRRPASAARRQAANGGTQRRPAQRGTTQRTSVQRTSTQAKSAQGKSAQGKSAQGASGSRTPTRPAAAAKRPSSSASAARKPAPKPAPKPGGARSAPRR